MPDYASISIPSGCTGSRIAELHRIRWEGSQHDRSDVVVDTRTPVSGLLLRPAIHIIRACVAVKSVFRP
jgi:hypothetical protein